MNFECTYVPFSDLFDWKEKSKIKSGDGKVVGKYKMFICSDTETKRYDDFLHLGESLVFGTGGKASCHYVNEPFAYSTDCIVAQPKIQGIYVKFYYYYLRQNRLALLQSTFTGSGLQHTSKKKIEKILVPVFDYTKQKEIVDKIEELFPQLDSGVEMLKKVKQQLEIYKQAVLKRAFEGKFQLIKISDICSIVRGGSPRPAGDERYYNGKIPFLKVADITNNKGMYLKTATYSIKKAGLTKTRLVPENTLMLSNSGATLGIPKICTFSTTFNDGIAAFIDFKRKEHLPFHYYFWLSKTKELRAINQGAAQPNLNTNIIGNISIPNISYEKQVKIAQWIESRLSICEHTDQAIDATIQQAEAQKQSILKKAFEGEI